MADRTSSHRRSAAAPFLDEDRESTDASPSSFSSSAEDSSFSPQMHSRGHSHRKDEEGGLSPSGDSTDHLEEYPLILEDAPVHPLRRRFNAVWRFFVGGDDEQLAEGGHGLLIWTIVGVIVGMIIGYIVNKHPPGHRAMELLSFPGEILLNMLRALVLPLITASVIVGIGALGEAGSTGRMAFWTLSYFAITTFIAAGSGIAWVLLIQPGNYGNLDDGGDAPDVESKSPLDSLLDVVRSMFPNNLFAAAHEMNVLGVITFAIGLGIVINLVGERARPLARFFDALNECIMKLVGYVIMLVPIGVCSLIIDKLGGSGEDFFSQLEQLFMYAVTVVVGLVFHSLILLPTLYFIITRRNPFKFMWGISQALLIAIGTSSSAASLPVTMKCCEEFCGIPPHITRFILPLGATVNMNGTALYEAIAALFVAQSLDIELSVGQICVTVLTATLAAVGAAGIPEAGLVTMVMVFSAVGLPLESIGLLFSIDWALDRLRTGANVLGDAFGAAIVCHLENKKQQQLAHSAARKKPDDISPELSIKASDPSNEHHDGSKLAPSAFDEESGLMLGLGGNNDSHVGISTASPAPQRVRSSYQVDERT